MLVVGCVGVAYRLESYCLQIIGCILMLVNYRLCRCRLVYVMLMLTDYKLCSCNVVIAVISLECFRLCRCNALTSVCYHYSSLKIEVVELWCNDNTRTALQYYSMTVLQYFVLVDCFMMCKCNRETLIICS